MNLARALLFLVLAGSGAAQTAAPEQPIPFSHKLHAGALKVSCKTCHASPDPGEMMTIAPARNCMQCHSAIKTESPSIQKLAAFAKNDREIHWNRVYQIPEFVRFSHRVHTAAGGTCADCHGQVAQREQLYKEVNLSMGDCMDCHRMKKAALDCNACHDLQNQ